MHTSLDIIRKEHAAVSAVLKLLLRMATLGHGDTPERYFDVLRAVLFYIGEFPEKLHHPRESTLLFPAIAQARPELRTVIERLEQEHESGEARVRELQHLLLGWELLGEGRRAAFVQAARDYVEFYLAHMKAEENEILGPALELLTDQEWTALDAAFESNPVPLAEVGRDPRFDRLYARIVWATASSPW